MKIEIGGWEMKQKVGKVPVSELSGDASMFEYVHSNGGKTGQLPCSWSLLIAEQPRGDRQRRGGERF